MTIDPQGQSSPGQPAGGGNPRGAQDLRQFAGDLLDVVRELVREEIAGGGSRSGPATAADVEGANTVFKYRLMTAMMTGASLRSLTVDVRREHGLTVDRSASPGVCGGDYLTFLASVETGCGNYETNLCEYELFNDNIAMDRLVDDCIDITKPIDSFVLRNGASEGPGGGAIVALAPSLPAVRP